MKPKTRPSRGPVDSEPSYERVAVTKENFHAKIIDFYRLYPDEFVMIRAKYETPGEKQRGDRARAGWFPYLAARGFDKTLRFFESQLSSGKSVMVVCEDPSRFDLDYRRYAEAAE